MFALLDTKHSSSGCLEERESGMAVEQKMTMEKDWMTKY
jgi:hypothetical protein